MTRPVQPDYSSAVVAYLRRQPEILAFTPAARVVLHIPDSADMPENYIGVAAAGGRGQLGRSPYMHARVDVQVYGSTGYEAMRGARVVASILTPPWGSSRIVEQGCVIAEVEPESGLLRLETQQGWPFVFASYGLTVLMEAVA